MKNGYKRKNVLKLLMLSLMLIVGGIVFFQTNQSVSCANSVYQPPNISEVNSYSGKFDNIFHYIGVTVKYFNGTFDENYSYQWYKGGKNDLNKIEGENKSTLKVKSVSDSGYYYCQVTYTANDGSSSIFSPVVAVNIEPKSLINENLQLSRIDATYNGYNNKPDATIIASEGFELTDDDYEIKYIYENAEEISSLLSFNKETRFVNAGSYYVRLMAKEGGNYKGYAEQIFKINPIEIEPMEIRNYNTISKEYDSTTNVHYVISNQKEYFLSGVLIDDNVTSRVVSAKYNSHLVNSADKIIAKIELGGKDALNYVLKSDLVLHNVKIQKRKIYVNWENLNVTFNNKEQLPDVKLPEGADKYGKINLYFSNKYKDSGKYKIEVYSTNPNIEITNAVKDFTILPYEIDVQWNDLDLTYNKEFQQPTIESVKDLLGNDLKYSIIGKERVTGTYSAHVAFENQNYIATQETKSKQFEIKPFPLELIWKESEFVFNNKIQQPSFDIKNSLGENILVQLIGGGRYVGFYSCRAVVNNINYVIQNPNCEFTIKEKVLTKGDVSLSGEIQSNNDIIIDIDEDAKGKKSPNSKYEIVKSYNIGLSNKNLEQETGYLYTISIKLDDEIMDKSIKVYCVKDNGDIEEIKVNKIKSSSSISFKVGDFSEFLICIPEKESVVLIVLCSIFVASLICLFLFWLFKKYKIYFVTNGGGNAETLKVRCLESFGLPKDLKKRGYVFEGWYLEPELITRYDKNIFRLKNLTLYANWQESKSAILEELEEDITSKSKLKDLIISKRNVKMFIDFSELLDKLLELEADRKKVVYKIVPMANGYNILNSEIKEVVAWSKSFTDAKFLGKILALEDNTKLVILNKIGKEIKTIELNAIKREMCLYKKFYNVIETKKQNKYNIYNIRGEWYIKKNNESEACAFAKNKKDIIRIGAIYSLISNSKLILYSVNGKVKKEIKVVYK